jgi:hypothetical protein
LIWNIPDNLDRGFEVNVISNPDFFEFCCEHNCDSYISQFGGTKISGVYVLKHNYLELYQLVKHYIIYDGDDYIDVTPFSDNRTTNWFIPLKIENFNVYVNSLENLENLNYNTNVYYTVYMSNNNIKISIHANPILNTSDDVITIATNISNKSIAEHIKNNLVSRINHATARY